MTISDQLEVIIKSVPDLKKLYGKDVLITGGSGFLGSWFNAVFQHLNQNYDANIHVRSVDSFIATDENNHLGQITDPRIKFVQEDISELTELPYPVEYIIHAAGIASPVYYRKYPIETIDGMVLGLSNLLKLSTKWRPEGFLYFSSSEIYGNPRHEDVPMKETYNGNVSCLGPRSCYDESKRMGETMCASYRKIHDIPVNWVRPFNVSGPGMRKVDDRVLPKFIFAGLTGQPVTIHMPGTQTRTFCYITDAMTGFFKALLAEKKGEVYNIGRAEEEINMIDLAEKINLAFEGNLKIEKVEVPVEYPQDQALRRCPDIKKAQSELDFNPSVDLDTMIARTIEWAKTKI
jgi:UDP-glucuronate decarboxylase